MKKLIFILLYTTLSFPLFSNASENYREVGFVNSVEFSKDYIASVEFPGSFEMQTMVNISYLTGGCNSSMNQPRLRLKHVSTIEHNPHLRLERPTLAPELIVTVQVVVEEKEAGSCAMSYVIDFKENLSVLLKKQAAAIGIDLNGVNADYQINFLAPSVQAGDFLRVRN